MYLKNALVSNFSNKVYLQFKEIKNLTAACFLSFEEKLNFLQTWAVLKSIIQPEGQKY